MPCYNAEKYISTAIQSILNQDMPDFELLIINDGSTDATDTEINKFRDNRIRYNRNQKNFGNYSARNLGIQLSKGKYIAMLDSDDIARPNYLTSLSQYLDANPKVGCVGALSEIINEFCDPIGFINRPLNHRILKTYLIKDNFVTQSTMMLRSRLIKKHSLFYDEKFKYSGDYDFIVRASFKFLVTNIGKVLIQYRKHDQQISIAKQQLQEKFADLVRIKQLEKFGVKYSREELSLHLKLMKEAKITKSEINSSIKWFNNLINANDKTLCFDKKELISFFSKVILLAMKSA